MQSNVFSKKYGSWAIVTGASDGIGQTVAIELASKGLNIVLVARRAERLQFTVDEIKKVSNVETKVLAIDLGERGSTDIILENTKTLNVGLIAAAAGFGTSGGLIKSDIKSELNMVDVNCRAVLELTYHFAKTFAEQKRGGIILMDSLVGFQGAPNAANYGATKAYIQSLAEGLHFELKPFGVDVLASAPGPVESGFAARADMRMGQAATPKEVAVATIAALGKKITVRPGFLAKFLGWSLSTMNRWGRIKVMQLIMGGMTKHKQ